MVLKFSMVPVLVAAAVIAFGVAVPAAADDLTEVSGYALTDAGLAKFAKATQNLAALPGACEEEEDDGSNAQTIDDLVAKLDATPGAKAAVQSAGMNTREFVVFTFAMMQAGMAAWAQSQPNAKLPPGISQANIDFYRKNEAALTALGENDPCAEASTGEESQG